MRIRRDRGQEGTHLLQELIDLVRSQELLLLFPNVQEVHSQPDINRHRLELNRRVGSSSRRDVVPNMVRHCELLKKRRSMGARWVEEGRGSEGRVQ